MELLESNPPTNATEVLKWKHFTDMNRNFPSICFIDPKIATNYRVFTIYVTLSLQTAVLNWRLRTFEDQGCISQ